MSRIPIAKPSLGREEAEAASEAILSGWVTQGPKVEAFERAFAGFTGAKYAVAVSNCTTALHLAMIVAGVGKDDEVICPSLSYIATANCIRYAGATPVFAEVKEDYNLDPDDALRKVTPKTKAILLVHQIGMPGDVEAFQEIARQKNLILIEDAACASGSEYHNRKIGSHSDLVCFSFHPRKVITTGEGGMITTGNGAYDKRLRLLRQHGMSVSDRVRHSSEKLVFEEHVELGYNYRMTDIQAAIGIEQLKKLPDLLKNRRGIADRYFEGLSSCTHLRLPVEAPEVKSNYQSFSVYLKSTAPLSRNELMQCLLDRDISTRRGIMTSHRERAYGHLKGIQLPVSEDLCDRSLLLPIFAGLTSEEQRHVITCVKEALA